MARTLFRSRALAGRSTADRIDEPVRLVTIPTWAALTVAVVVLAAGAAWLFGSTVAVTAAGTGVIVNDPVNTRVVAPTEGVVTTVAELGAQVRRGQVVARVTPHDDGSGTRRVESVVRAPFDGSVVGIGPGPGGAVQSGEYLLTLAPDAVLQLAYLYVPARQGELVKPGMEVRMAPVSVDTTDTGLLLGNVTQVSPLPVSANRIAYVLADPDAALRLAQEEELVEVTVLLREDPDTPTGLAWTQPPGPDEYLTSGTPTEGTIVLGDVAPYRAFVGGVG